MPPETGGRPRAEVSVVVPAYRAAATIARALESVANQTLRPAEVIVVDDGSDDDTAAAAEACRERLGDIDLQVVEQANGGAGAARNRAMTAATGTYLAFLDADDEWLPEHLEASLAAMENGRFVLTAHNEWIVADGRETLNDCARRFQEGADPYVSLYRKGYISTSTVVIRRDATGAGLRFDETLANAQDFDFWLALTADPETSFHLFDAPLARYHITSGSIMSHTRRRLDCCRVIAKRHYASLRARPGSPLAHFWFRITALYAEAWAAFAAAGNRPGQLRLIGQYLPDMAMSTLDVLTQQPDRPSMSDAAEDRPAANGGTPAVGDAAVGRGVAVTLWIWSLGVLGVYLYQFRHLVDAIAARLGLS